MTDFQLRLHINPNIQPVQQPIRRTPFHTKQKIEDEINRLQSLDIIEKVNGPTTWLNPVVAVPKSNGRIRLCLDMREANKAITRERHIIPKLEDILTELSGATYFTKLDLTEGYHQIELEEESRHITTFATHLGPFRYKRLIFGISCAFESFQKQIEMVISDCRKTKNISDDILIWGNTLEEHNANLENALSKLSAKNLKINLGKCIFAAPSLTFNGHVFSSNDITPDPAKVNSIKNLPAPTNVSEVKSLLGMVNFCNRYVPNYSTLTEPIRRLTKKDTPFIWSEEQQSSLNTLKQKLTNAPTLTFYNPEADTKLYVDASPCGLGAILAQKQKDNSYQPIA